MAGCFFVGGSFGEQLHDKLGGHDLPVVESEHEGLTKLGQVGGGHGRGHHQHQLEPHGGGHRWLQHHSAGQLPLHHCFESFTDKTVVIGERGYYYDAFEFHAELKRLVVFFLDDLFLRPSASTGKSEGNRKVSNSKSPHRCGPLRRVTGLPQIADRTSALLISPITLGRP